MTDLDSLVSRADPVRDIIVPAADRTQATRIASGRGYSRASAGRTLRLSVAAISVTALATVVAIAVVLGAGPLTVPPRAGHPTDTVPPGASLLQHLALTAARQPVLQPGPGHYVYWTSTDVETEALGPLQGAPGTWGYVGDGSAAGWFEVTDTTQWWLPGAGAGRMTASSSAPVPANATAEAAWEAAGEPKLPAASTLDTTVTAGAFDLRFLGTSRPDSLSSDPGTLYRQLLAIARRHLVSGEPGGAAVPRDAAYSTAIMLLRLWQVPPEVRSAAFQLLGTAPGATVQTNASSPDGRLGVGVTVPNTTLGVDEEVVFDPSTSFVIGETDTAISGPLDGLVADSGSLTAPVVVASTTATS
ncbi:MAG: CU044_5270 family protein [Acidimicrobiales bacterium]